MVVTTPDVIMESKDFKPFMDFMDSKDATYHMNFWGYTNISIQCIANDGRYVGELIRSSHRIPKYHCIKPIRISFDSKTRESLSESPSKANVTVEGSNVVFGKDQYVVKSQYMNEPLPPIIEDTTERIQEMTLSRNEFESVVNILHKEKMQLARLRFLVKSRSLEVSTDTELSTSWSFRLLTFDVYFSEEEYRVYFAQEEFPEPPQVIDSYYDVNDLLSVIKAMRYHYARKDMMFSLSLLQDGRLLFESDNRKGALHRRYKEATFTHRCILNRVVM